MRSPENLEANLATLADPNRGRLVIVGLSAERNWRLFTGMGGRSAGSRNRYYHQLRDLSGNGDYVRTAIHDIAGQTGDASATLYTAHRNRNNWHVASNGEQTESILAVLATGGFAYDERAFYEAQLLFENEGRQNGYTARISTAVPSDGWFAFMGKIVQENDHPEESSHDVYPISVSDSPTGLNPGEAFVIYTYDGKGELGPDYSPPRKVLLPGTLEESMDTIWNTWDPNTKAGLVGKEIERGSYNGSKGSERFTYAFRSIHPGRA